MSKAFSPTEIEAIRARLLAQGEALFSTYGLKKTNVEDLALAVGISKGAFYRFYASKEDLFLEVIEAVEQRMRQEVLAAVDRPGPNPRARLLAIFTTAFHTVEAIPLLQIFTSGDYDWLMQRISAQLLQAHQSSDQIFFETLIQRCRAVGIPIQITGEQITALLYPLIPSLFQQSILARDAYQQSLNMHLELIAAYCLGEVQLQPRPGVPVSSETERHP